MTLQEFYDRIGGDYKATISRLPSEALIKKFVLKYPGIRQADKLLYQAKECRNKCITAAFSAEEAEKPKPNQESDKL